MNKMLTKETYHGTRALILCKFIEGGWHTLEQFEEWNLHYFHCENKTYDEALKIFNKLAKKLGYK